MPSNAPAWLPALVLAAVAPQFSLAASNDTTTAPCLLASQQQAASIKATSGMVRASGDAQYQVQIDAKTLYECAKSIPFNAEEANIMLNIFKDYSEFQTTLAYLKDPTDAYQQPAADILGMLDDLHTKVQNEGFDSHYDYELEIAAIGYSAHEQHYGIAKSIVGSLIYNLPDSLISVSSDGQALPEVFVTSDIINDVADASPVVEIEGKDVFEYLRDYITRTANTQASDPNTEWNHIMFNPAYQFANAAGGEAHSFILPKFQSTPIYNGESLSGTFKNGSSFEWKYTGGTATYLAGSNITSGEVYKKVLIDNTPAPSKRDGLTLSVNDHNVLSIRQESTTTRPDLQSVPYPGWPQDPIVVQEGFGVNGVVSGYIIQNRNQSIGVLSLPNFQAGGDTASALSYNQAVSDFITQARAAKVAKVVIDISGNFGGTVLAGYDTFKLFFPNNEITLNGRTRATKAVNSLGKLFSTVLQSSAISSDVQAELTDGYGVLSAVNIDYTTQPNGDAWPSWEDFFGPVESHGDQFSNNAMINLDSPIVSLNSNLGFNISGSAANPLPYDEAFKAEDIILLSDGTCGSTCSVFGELMTTNGGVKTVAVGGLPNYGPMQYSTGTRGSSLQRWANFEDLAIKFRDIGSNFDADSLAAIGITQDDIDNLPKPFTATAPWRTGGSVNAFDEIRLGGPEVPLHFTYEAAACRLYHTAETYRDITKLWAAAAAVAGGDMKACVQDSTDGPGSGRNDTLTDSPGFSNEDLWSAVNTTTAPGQSGDDDNSNSDDNSTDTNNNDDDSAGVAVGGNYYLVGAVAIALSLGLM